MKALSGSSAVLGTAVGRSSSAKLTFWWQYCHLLGTRGGWILILCCWISQPEKQCFCFWFQFQKLKKVLINLCLVISLGFVGFWGGFFWGGGRAQNFPLSSSCPMFISISASPLQWVISLDF